MKPVEVQFHEGQLDAAKQFFNAKAIDAAFEAVKAVLVCVPESVVGVSLLGHIGLADARGKRALDGFRRAVVLDESGDPRIWMNYGNALVAANRGALAVDIYRTVLCLDPDHVMATTQLAVWHLNAGEGVSSRSYLRKLVMRPDMPAHAALRVAEALRRFGARQNARPFYDRAICPILAICRAAYFGRAMVLRRPAAPELSIIDFQRALVLDPGYGEVAREMAGFALNVGVEGAETWSIRALCYGVADKAILNGLIDIAVGRRDKAAATLYLAVLIATEPDAPATQAARIAVHRLCNDVSGLEAMAYALPLSAETPVGIWNNLLLALSEVGSKTVEEYGARALQVYSDEAVLWFNQGLFYFRSDAYDQALRLFRKAMLLDPGYAKALNQASICVSGFYDNEQAETFSRRCLMVSPDHAVAWMNRGLFAKARRRLHEGIACLRRAVDLAGGSYPDASYNLALHLFAVGKLEEGFKRYRDRWKTSIFSTDKRDFPQPEWLGPKVAPNADLLVFMEQGMGDEVLYSWILPWVRDDCRALTVECDRRLVKTFVRTFPDITFVPRMPAETKKLKHRNFDYQFPLVQTAEFYAERIHCQNAALTAGADLRGRRITPRLRTDPVRLSHWRNYLAKAFGDRLKVGVAWRSGLRTRLRNQQYLTPEELALAMPPGVAVINLQYDHTEEEVAALTDAGLRAGFTFVTPPGINLRDDLDDIFALAEGLDIVVSPLISTPWMAAAVGTPSLVFRSNENGHIWLQFSQRYIPWAPNIKLFFRSPQEPWDAPIADIRAELMCRVGG